jgi:hypothetical protein
MTERTSPSLHHCTRDPSNCAHHVHTLLRCHKCKVRVSPVYFVGLAVGFTQPVVAESSWSCAL